MDRTTVSKPPIRVRFPAGYTVYFKVKFVFRLSLCTSSHSLSIHFLIRHHATVSLVCHDVSLHIAEPQIPDTLLAPTPFYAIPRAEPWHLYYKTPNTFSINKEIGPKADHPQKSCATNVEVLTVHPLSGTGCRRRITFLNGVGRKVL